MSWEPRRVCPRCRRPETVCYCVHITPISTSTRVLLLQHPRERDVAIGTARMASLCLPNSELCVGVSWERSPELARALADPGRPPVLLYPGDGAIDVAERPPEGPVTLVVIDGTWSQAKTIVRDNPVLRSLPRYTFRPAAPSEYRIRREPHEAYVSTIEALAYVLGALERDPERFQALLAPFRAMIDAQIEHERRRGGTRSRHAKRRPTLAARIPRIFGERFADLVCVVGEANAWPYRSRERGALYQDELVHWVAYRPATGEGFDQIVAPRNPLAPRTPEYVGLSKDELAHGADPERLVTRWRTFIRDTDVVCFWGHYGAALFAASGGLLPPGRVDLRHVVRDYTRGKVGDLESLGLRVEPPRRLASGRAGLRLGVLAEVVRYFGHAMQAAA